MKTKLLILLAFALLGAWMAAQTLPIQAQIPISVSVTGFVANPGVYQMSALNRLSDAIERTRNPKTKTNQAQFINPLQKQLAEQDSLYDNFQALRSVKITRGEKTTVYDLQKFLRIGKLEHNPLLRDSDVITVSAMFSTVSIHGGVYLPGDYEFIPGDRLSDILILAQGFISGADLKTINIYRYKDNLIDFDIIKLDLSAYPSKPEVADFALKAFDRVIISRDSEQRRAWKITVEGNVKAPGDYLIGDKTTLYDVLLQCGGPNLRGDLKGALLISGTHNLETDPEFERLKELSMTQMTPMEYNYLRSKMRQIKGKYNVDVFDAWGSKGEKSNPLLRDGDYLYVPEVFDMVYVSGQVRRPGLVPWVEGKNWEYYISSAGGFTNNRRYSGTRIIRAASGNWVKPAKKLVINPGDNIFVAEKTDRDAWLDIKDVFLLTSQFLTIIISVLALTAK
ncbi:MAG: SLBB domain-containing protein [Candidatus Cloacimonadaceae bacterium]|nr:SLBB domain-containing protein [Candidatus Cloacimonadaceae bacterium]